MALRKLVYGTVTQKDMVWFDTKMSAEGTEDEQGPLGAGGLMAKFTREADNICMALSLASGMLLQYLTTCLVLAFQHSWALTLVILSVVPILMFIQALSQAFAGPLLAVERSQTATAAALVDHPPLPLPNHALQKTPPPLRQPFAKSSPPAALANSPCTP